VGACGFKNVLNNFSRYPEVNLDQLKNLQIDFLLLSSEPYPFKEKHVTELKQYLLHTNVVLADGEMFSWYGIRMQDAPAYFSKLITKIAAF